MWFRASTMRLIYNSQGRSPNVSGHQQHHINQASKQTNNQHYQRTSSIFKTKPSPSKHHQSTQWVSKTSNLSSSSTTWPSSLLRSDSRTPRAHSTSGTDVRARPTPAAPLLLHRHVPALLHQEDPASITARSNLLLTPP